MRVFMILAFTGLVAAPALAQTAPAAAPEGVTVTDTRITCIRQDAPTGSRIGGKKVCHTEAEWKQIHANAQLDMMNLQDRMSNSFQGAANAAGQ